MSEEIIEYSKEFGDWLNSIYEFEPGEPAGLGLTIFLLLVGAILIALLGGALKSQLICYISAFILFMGMIVVPLMLALAFPDEKQAGWFGAIWCPFEDMCVLTDVLWVACILIGMCTRGGELMLIDTFETVFIMFPTVHSIACILKAISERSLGDWWFTAMLVLTGIGWINFIYFPKPMKEKKKKHE